MPVNGYLSIEWCNTRISPKDPSDQRSTVCRMFTSDKRRSRCCQWALQGSQDRRFKFMPYPQNLWCCYPLSLDFACFILNFIIILVYGILLIGNYFVTRDDLPQKGGIVTIVKVYIRKCMTAAGYPYVVCLNFVYVTARGDSSFNIKRKLRDASKSVNYGRCGCPHPYIISWEQCHATYAFIISLAYVAPSVVLCDFPI